VIVETPAHASTVGEVRGDTPELRDVWQIESGAFDDLVTAGADTPWRWVEIGSSWATPTPRG